MEPLRKNRLEKRCAFCGRFYRPNQRVAKWQKSCGRQECRKKRKAESQRGWEKNNPGYFCGRYANTKRWREKNPNYQRERRAKQREIQDEIGSKSSIRTIRLVVPAKVLFCEIQDEIWVNSSVLLKGYSGTEGSPEIQDEIAFFQGVLVAVRACDGQKATP